MLHQKTASLYKPHYTILTISIILSLAIVSYAKPKSLTIIKTKSSNSIIFAPTIEITKIKLQSGKIIKNELTGGQNDSFTFSLKANQYMRIIVEQKGIDVIATLYNSKNEKVYEIDSFNGTMGPEPICFVAESAGNYRLEIKSLDKTAQAGEYEVKIIELHNDASEIDRNRANGFKALAKGQLLHVEGKEENDNLVISNYEEAIKLLNKTQELEAKATAINNLGQFYDTKRNFTKAEVLYTEALRIRKKILGEDHFDTIASISNLASLYYAQNNYTKAEPLYMEALEKSTKTLGKDHPDTVNAINRLALLYYNKNEYTKAEPLYIQALEIRKKTLEENHPDILNSINNLANLYYAETNYTKAEPLYIQVLEFRKKILGENHPDTITSINNLANLYYAETNYIKAEPLYIQALEIRKKTLGENHPDTIISINNIAKVNYDKHNYAKAESFYMQALEIRKKTLGENHPDTITSINNLANVNYEKHSYAKAESLYMEVLEFRKKTLGENHPDTIISINNLANLYSNRDFNKAETLYLEVLKIRQKVLGENHPDTLTSINNLARLYYGRDYNKAEALYLEVLKARKKILGENHPETLISMSNLANLYRDKGDYDKAELLAIKAAEIARKVLGDTVTTATVIYNLAGFYYRKGNYTKAESLCIESIEINRRVFGEINFETVQAISSLALTYYHEGEYNKAENLYIQTLDILNKLPSDDGDTVAFCKNNLALLYHSKGDYSKAEGLYLEALENFRKVLGENHLQVAICLNNLAGLYNCEKEYNKAEVLLIKSVEICRTTLGDHSNTATSLNNLGLVYYNKKEYSKAESYYLQSLEICKKEVGENHPETAQALNNLALLYDREKQYNKAEPLYFEALEIRKKVLGENHPDTINSVNQLSAMYFCKGDYKKAVKYNVEANEQREQNLKRNLLIGSEREKQLYLQNYAYETDIAISLHLQSPRQNLVAAKSALTQILRRKGRSIDAANQSIEALHNRSNPEDVVLLDSLTNKKTQLSNLTIQGLGKNNPEEYQKQIKALQDEVDQLEYKISERSLEFRTQSQPITLEAIQQAIPNNATLVEFVLYFPVNTKTREYEKPRYVVYLLNSQAEPLWADLGKAATIDNLIDELREKLSSKETNIEKEIKPLARRLDELIMRPVRKLGLADGRKRLLIAPDGKLNLIPFAALVDEKGKYLVEDYQISYLTSGRDLLRLKIKVDSKQLPVIIGNPDFGVISDASNIKEGSTIFARLGFKQLPATELEAKAIKTILPDSQLLLQKQATEEALNKLTAPSILHIATHGFFLKEEQREESSENSSRIGEIIGTDSEKILASVKVENPLLLSGIALAGANLHDSDKNQGIFTALKATGLNLWGTKLVVLSACDTGVGEVKTGDGIYGLRRALVLAGSESQVMSLWPVSDDGTKELMVDYYKRLQKKEGRAAALRNVQLELLKNPKRRHPFYWASFIQSGEWANLDGKR